MATWTHTQPAVAEPVVRPRRDATKPRAKPRAKARSRARSRSGILWIAVTGVLLAGVVFVNLAVLRLNLALDTTNRSRANLQAQVAVDQSELSVALTASHIQARAHALGLVPSNQSGFVNLATR
jgi:hypothetical protein